MKHLLLAPTILCTILLFSCGHADGCRVVGTQLICEDGTISNLPLGQDGEDGSNGADGATGPRGPEGEPGLTGEPGVSGSSCSVVETPTGALITCDDGTSAEIQNGYCIRHGHTITCVGQNPENEDG